MKQLMITILFASIILGCKNNLPLDRYNYFPTEINLSHYQHLDFIKVKKGSSIKVNLDENPSTGHHWHTKCQEDCVVSINEGIYQRHPVAEGIVGSGGVRTFDLSGLEKGTCMIEFSYVGPGTDQKIAEKKAIYFIVE